MRGNRRTHRVGGLLVALIAACGAATAAETQPRAVPASGTFTDSSSRGAFQQDGTCSAYRLFITAPDPIDWSVAKTACESLGGHLATIHSEAENEEVWSVAQDHAWIGASDAAQEGSWQWVTGEPWAYTNWMPGEPNGSTSENYLRIQPGPAFPGGWNDAGRPPNDCTKYVCEFERSGACPVARVVASRRGAAEGSRVATCVEIEMPEDVALGSYGATLEWDAGVLTFVRAVGGEPPFDAPIVNEPEVGDGSLSLADASGNGATGTVRVACFEFDVVGAAQDVTALDLQLTSLFAAQTFEDLTSFVVDQDDDLAVTRECTVGDLNGDQQVNSGDALIVLSAEIGLPVPARSLEAIAAGCGDANGDSLSDSIDANIILTYEVGLPIDPGFPVGESNRAFDSCPDPAFRIATSGAGTSREERLQAVSTRVAKPIDLVATAKYSASRRMAGDLLELELSLAPVRGTKGIGSYALRLEWDSNALEYLDLAAGEFGQTMANTNDIKEGRLALAAASPVASSGNVRIGTVRFRALSPIEETTERVELRFLSAGGPGPVFENLLQGIEVRELTPWRGSRER